MHKEKHMLAKLSVLFEVRRSSFHRHSEGGNKSKKQNKQKVSQSLIVIFIIVLLWGVRKGRSVAGVRGPVRTVVRGPGP